MWPKIFGAYNVEDYFIPDKLEKLFFERGLFRILLRTFFFVRFALSDSLKN